MVSLASEFPNDNPALHCGVIWICDEPTGPARAVLPPVRVAPPVSAVEEPLPATVDEPVFDSLAPPEDEAPDASAASIVVEELEPLEAEVSLEGAFVVEELDAGPLPDARESGVTMTPVFDELVAGPIANDAASSVLPPAPEDPFTLLVCTLADVAIGVGSPHVASMLPGLLFDARLPEPLDADVLEALRAAGICDGSEVTPSFVAVTAAWRAILRGTSDDFDACGAAMLDEWASDLLARLLAAPGRAPALRQELRSRGVAAFGIAA